MRHALCWAWGRWFLCSGTLEHEERDMTNIDGSGQCSSSPHRLQAPRRHPTQLAHVILTPPPKGRWHLRCMAEGPGASSVSGEPRFKATAFRRQSPRSRSPTYPVLFPPRPEPDSGFLPHASPRACSERSARPPAESSSSGGPALTQPSCFLLWGIPDVNGSLAPPGAAL